MANSAIPYSELTFVSTNHHKYIEVCAILGLEKMRRYTHIAFEPQDIDLTVVIRHKINGLRKIPELQGPFLVEHTGLKIGAWNGLPGGLTAQFLATVGCDGICRMMRGFDNRQATAEIVFGFYDGRDDGTLGYGLYRGEVHGKITEEPHKGLHGFGWDSIFIPDGENKSYAEMTLQEKNRTSMRRKALDIFAREVLDTMFELR